LQKENAVRVKNFHYFLGFLGAMSMAGAFLVYLGTSRVGAEVSSDGLYYLSVAANLLKGKGFVDLYGNPLVQWPPLYPALLAFISLITRADVFLVGWYLNVLLFALIVFCSGLLLRKTFPDRMVLAYIGSTIIAASPELIQLCASVLSDPLFLLFVVLFLLATRYFIETPKTRYLLWMGLLACLGALDRYVGLALVLGGAAFLVYFYRRNYARGLSRGVLFLLSGLPLMLWCIFHNYPVKGRLFGSYFRPNIGGNIYITVEKVLYWFVPYSLIKLATPFGLLIGILLVALFLSRPPDWKRWLERLVGQANFANSALIIIYVGVLIFYSSYYEIDALNYNRFHIILLPSLLIVIFSVYEELGLPRIKTKIRDGVLLAVFIVWLAYPFSKIQHFELQARINGGIVYNSYNFADIAQSDFLKQAEELPAGQKIYSNYERAGWFYLRRDILILPRLNLKTNRLDPTSVKNFRNSIGPNGGGYIVWFNTINTREYLPSLDQISQIIKLRPVFTSDVGDIYYIQSDLPASR